MLFAGQEDDGATGLHFHTARYYSPLLGRYLSEDPIGFASGDLNLYRYVGNRPNLTFDPSGLQATESLIYRFNIGESFPAIPALAPAAPLAIAPAGGGAIAGGIGATLGTIATWIIIVVVVVIVAAFLYCFIFGCSGGPQPTTQAPGFDEQRPPTTYTGNLGVQRGVGNVKQALPPKTPTTANPPTVNPGSGGGFGKGYYETNAVEGLENLTGKTREEAEQALEDSGFEKREKQTEGGYEEWRHSDGSRVWIRPNGEIVRVGPKQLPEGGVPGKTKLFRPRYGPDGKRLGPDDSHSTGEILSGGR